MREINCLFCNAKGDLLRQEGRFAVRKCLADELVFIGPEKTAQEKEALKNNCFFQWNFTKELIAGAALRLIKRFKAQGDLLEIGAGGGQFLVSARKQGFKVSALELSRNIADFLNSQAGISTELYEEDFFAGKEFDIIYHCDVLSHFEQPLKMFQALHKKLKKDGIMVFETGNLGGVSTGWLRLVSDVGAAEHVYLFSQSSLKKLLEKTGFELVWSKSYSMVLFRCLYNIFRRKKRENVLKATPGCPENREFSLLQRLKGWLIFFLVYVLGGCLPESWPGSMICVARKNKA